MIEFVYDDERSSHQLKKGPGLDIEVVCSEVPVTDTVAVYVYEPTLAS
jgi:hypothetical protein